MPDDAFRSPVGETHEEQLSHLKMLLEVGRKVAAQDTLDTVLPLDGNYDISLERRFFIQVLPLDTLATVNGRVIVDVDGRNLFNQQGTLPVDPPFRYVYVFNQATTRVIELF